MVDVLNTKSKILNAEKNGEVIYIGKWDIYSIYITHDFELSEDKSTIINGILCCYVTDSHLHSPGYKLLQDRKLNAWGVGKKVILELLKDFKPNESYSLW